jgi:hypothetical protein
MFADAGLFDVAAPPPVSLADRFLVPPFSVLNRREGTWQDRKRRWLTMGIKSEIGRGEDLLYNTAGDDYMSRKMAEMGGTSVFDPVLCELVYRWHTNPGDAVLDPFSGGSVRGVVASTLQRDYTGIDLREEQVAANWAQADLCDPDHVPLWLAHDSARMDDGLLAPTDMFDLVFSCPPYADLEVYSDDPADISNMDYDRFAAVHADIIRRACAHLRDNRFACWVISDVRDKAGSYRGLVADTIRAFEAAGLRLHNEAILLDPIGTAAARAGRPFVTNRKLARVHQVVLIFTKGNIRAAADRLQDDDAAAAATATTEEL